MDALLALVRARHALTAPEADAIAAAWGAPRGAARGEALLRPGEPCRRVWFLDRGYVREVYAYLDRALDEARYLPAAERYAAFEREHPEILLHVPLRHVASYLGMTPQSLSRVRAQARPLA